MQDLNLTKKFGSLMSLLGLHRTARLFFSLWLDRRMPWWLKLSAVSGLVYIFSPLDVIPEISGIGLLDDIIVALLIMQAFAEYAPRHVFLEHCEKLKISPDKALIDVPHTVQDALELYRWVTNKSKGDDKSPPPVEQAQDQGESEPPQYLRYSAFQGGEE